MKYLFILLSLLLLQSTSLISQTSKTPEEVKEIMADLNMYQLEKFIVSTEEEIYFDLYYDEIYRRIKNKIPVTTKTVQVVCEFIKLYDGDGDQVDNDKQQDLANKKIRKLAKLDCQHDPYLSFEIMHQYYWVYRTPKASIHSDRGRIEKLEFIRKTYYEDFLKLQQLNFQIACSMYHNQTAEFNDKVETYLVDVFDMEYFKLDIDSKNEKANGDIYRDYYELQKQAFIMLAGYYLKTDNNEMLENLKLAHFQKIYLNSQVLPKFDQILEFAGLEKVDLHKN